MTDSRKQHLREIEAKEALNNKAIEELKSQIQLLYSISEKKDSESQQSQKEMQLQLDSLEQQKQIFQKKDIENVKVIGSLSQEIETIKHSHQSQVDKFQEELSQQIMDLRINETQLHEAQNKRLKTKKKKQDLKQQL